MKAHEVRDARGNVVGRVVVMTLARPPGNGWTRLTPPGEKCAARFTKAGWLLKQCGHPTANHGWLAYDPDGFIHSLRGKGPGMGFKNSREARAYVDEQLRGER